MSRYDELADQLRGAPARWCVTGAAGFIGSHLVERLLDLNQEVVGLDNFSTGRKENIEFLKSKGGKFKFLDGDVCNESALAEGFAGVRFVLHQAALGSVPRSIEDPISSNQANVSGFLSVLVQARISGAEQVVYASSSSVYGDAPALPMREEIVGNLLSPYAATKRIDELYSGVFSRTYGLRSVGLRYFNVFGPRQDPNGAYAAVIPRWISALIKGEECVIYGDGETSRDFCFVENVVQANILAAFSSESGSIFNIACGAKTSLNQLYEHLANELSPGKKARYQEFRSGDIRHSFADITAAGRVLGYTPKVAVGEGLKRTVSAYRSKT